MKLYPKLGIDVKTMKAKLLYKLEKEYLKHLNSIIN